MSSHIFFGGYFESRKGYIAQMIGRRVNAQGKRNDYNKDIKIEQYVEQRHNGKSNTLTTVQKDNVVIDEPLSARALVRDVRYRYLTIAECERLQTFDVGFVGNAGISKSQAYKCLGNSWSVDVIAHIFRGLL
jgi:site-specific DNA-cytosine methylase